MSSMSLRRKLGLAAAVAALVFPQCTAQQSPPSCDSAPRGIYDYIIVGAGASGIPLADKLSEAGKTVLLLEKGPPSSGRWGGSMRPSWLDGTNLTRFDVPGLCNEFWINSTGVACTDSDQMNGCVLGGGTAVNAGLWLKPNPLDWDEVFPPGWHSADMQAATDHVFSRIPGTWHPSVDGQLYRQEGFNVLASALTAGHWAQVVPNDEPTRKNHTFGHTTYMYAGGERAGPMATYLVTAAQRNGFRLAMTSPVKRLVRSGGHATGVELECGTVVTVTQYTGRVVLSAGTFGSAKLLMRSGIGPSDQLALVQQSTDGPSMIAKQDWIDLPVGYNLMDHTNTDLIVNHPNVSFYNFDAAWNRPIASDKDSYLGHRTGILAQSAPNIGPMMWDQIATSDGLIRQLQWTARMAADLTVPGSSNHSMTISQYLGRNADSRGRVTLTRELRTNVTLAPYMQSTGDCEAIARGIKNLQAVLASVPGLTWVKPGPGQSAEDYLATLPRTPAVRRSNHWIGTAKMGLDDGRTNFAAGASVVDADTRVYGTDNVFVVDGSIMPGLMTGNPAAMMVIMAEQAAARMLASPPPLPAAAGQQCGGNAWKGPFLCRSPHVCTFKSDSSSVCV